MQKSSALAAPAFTVPDDVTEHTEGPWLRSDAGTLLAYRRLGPAARFRVFVRETTFVFVRSGVKSLHAGDTTRVAEAGRLC